MRKLRCNSYTVSCCFEFLQRNESIYNEVGNGARSDNLGDRVHYRSFLAAEPVLGIRLAWAPLKSGSPSHRHQRYLELTADLYGPRIGCDWTGIVVVVDEHLKYGDFRWSKDCNSV